MKDKERDQFDDLFREKLQGFEADTEPGDWEAIADRLAVKRSVPLRHTLRYWVAAAVISLLVVTGGLYVFKEEKKQMPVAEKIAVESAAQPVPSIEKEKKAEEPVARTIVVPREETGSVGKADDANADKAAVRTYAAVDTEKPESVFVAAVTESEGDEPKETVEAALRTRAKEKEDVGVEEMKREEEPVAIRETKKDRSLIAEAVPAKEKGKNRPVRRWGFGMGGGSVTAGTTNSLNAYTFKNTVMSDYELSYLNSPYFNEDAPKTNIHHKTPVTVGIGVSYYLNDRFSLQSGLNYTFLSSSWETNGSYHRETEQKLHFIGIPLSLSYKIAEWNRIQFYAAAGGMAEVNVGGRLSSRIFTGDEEIQREKNHIRMKEWMWSVNARVGASYPLLRFVSVYAEGGVGYYFDNGSKIETIRSEKPFNVNLQAGFRFGF